jgi:hypothetical protein
MSALALLLASAGLTPNIAAAATRDVEIARTVAMKPLTTTRITLS